MEQTTGRRIERVLIGAMALGLLGLGWHAQRLSGRVASLEQAADGAAAGETTAGTTGRRGSAGLAGVETNRGGAVSRGRDRSSGRGRGGRGLDAGTDDLSAGVAAVDLEDPETVEAIEGIVSEVYESEQEARSERWGEYMQARVEDEVTSFAEEAGLDEELTGTLTRMIVDASSEMHALRDSAMVGEITWDQMRDDRQTLRDEVTGQLQEMLGEEDASALGDRIRWLSRGR